MTLCKKFMYLGDDFQGLWTGFHSERDCAECVKILKKRPLDSLKEKELVDGLCGTCHEQSIENHTIEIQDRMEAEN